MFSQKGSKMSRSNEERLVLGDRHEKKTPLFIYFVAVLSAVGGLLFGYDTGVVSGAMLLIVDDFPLSAWMQGVVVSVTIISAWFSCLIAASLTDRYGRKSVIILASIVFALGSILMGFTYTIEMLIAGRVIVGIGIGLASMCVPMYIAEVAPQDIRGILVTINNCAITFGQLVASLVDGAFSNLNGGWRYMLGLAAVPAILQFCGFLFMPESPRWLISKGRYENAKDVLKRVRGSSANIEEEFNAIKSNCEEIEREHATQNTSIIRKILKSPTLRTALLVGCGLQMIQQLAGINTIMYYSASIIKMSGVRSRSTAIWLSSATSGMNCICSFLGLLFVERVGRRKLTLASLMGVILSLTLLAVSFQLASINSPSITNENPLSPGKKCMNFSNCNSCILDTTCGFCFSEMPNGTYAGECLASSNEEKSDYGACNTTQLPGDMGWAYNWCPSHYAWMTFMGLLFYLFFFSPGMGAMPWTINSEIYPLWARSTCYSIATSVNWLSNFIVSLTFLDLMDSITKYGAFYLYDGLAVLGFIFLFIMLPETKGVSLEEVEGLFVHPWWKDPIGSTEKHTIQYLEEKFSSTIKNLEEQPTTTDTS